MLRLVVVVAILPALLAGCEPSPQEQYFENLGALCGTTYEGRATFPTDGEAAIHREKLVAHVASCDPTEIRIPFFVGSDQSRTWILTRQGDGLQLKHDHRHEDGTPDEITMYGGRTQTAGTPLEQSFPADAHTQELIPEASTNVWTLRISDDGARIDYELDRHGQPRFRATLTRVGS